MYWVTANKWGCYSDNMVGWSGHIKVLYLLQIIRYEASNYNSSWRRKQSELIKQAQVYIESKPHERISVEHLAARFAIGRRNFDRRFIKATGNTPVEYAQRVKVEAAKKAFECSRKTITEVMYEVGYSDVKAFREVFRKITGISPLGYRNRYNKNEKTAKWQTTFASTLQPGQFPQICQQHRYRNRASLKQMQRMYQTNCWMIRCYCL